MDLRINVLELGVIKYLDAFKLQEELLRRRIEGTIPDTLIVLEHESVLTLGRLSSEENIIDRRYFDENRIDILKTRRGGKITYHAPGQIVLYPIIDLRDKKKDVSFYIDFLERTVARSLSAMGVEVDEKKRRGVWSGEKKIAFIGIGINSWVSYHGVSVNVNNSLDAFRKINPCGEENIEVTSVKECLGIEVDIKRAKHIFAKEFTRSLEEEYGYALKAA